MVLLGAGMDARPFRLAWPPGTPVFEVDRPEVLELKRDRVGDARPRCVRIEVPMSFAEDWPAALLERGFREDLRTVWLAEGVLVYLEEPAVRSLLRRVDRLSAPSSLLLVDVVSRGFLRRPELRGALEFLHSIGAPWRFGTDSPAELVRSLGWSIRAEDLRTYAAGVGRLLPGTSGKPTGFLCVAQKHA